MFDEVESPTVKVSASQLLAYIDSNKTNRRITSGNLVKKVQDFHNSGSKLKEKSNEGSQEDIKDLKKPVFAPKRFLT